MTITNTLARSSCTKCVEVLKELISGLQEDNGNNNNNNIDNKNMNSSRSSSSCSSSSELPPLTLLKAIARSSYQQRHEYDQWGQPKATSSSLSSRHRRHHYHHDHDPNPNHDIQLSESSSSSSSQSLLKIEEFEDGVRLTIPAVETTAPTLMKRWTQLQQPLPSTTTNHYQMAEQEEKEIVKIRDRDDVDDNIIDGVTVTTIPPALATSSSQETKIIVNPFKVELYCRKCSTTGPEAGMFILCYIILCYVIL